MNPTLLKRAFVISLVISVLGGILTANSPEPTSLHFMFVYGIGLLAVILGLCIVLQRFWSG